MTAVQFLRNFPFFEHIEEHNLEDVSTLFTLRDYEKGATIFKEGEQGTELYIIKSGVVKIYKDDHVREVILSIFRDGDFFGEMALLQDEQNRSAAAKTLEKSTVYVLKRDDFINLLKSHPETFLKILEATLDRLRTANELISDLTILDARTRIARMLLRLSGQYGIISQEGICINLKLTHQQMADMTGTVRETVTKALLDLQQQKLIQNDQRKIIIRDPDGLRSYVDF